MRILIIIDLQKDFIDGTLGTKEAQDIIEGVVKRITDSEKELILFTQDTHGEDYLSTLEGQNLPVIHCQENTPGWEIEPAVLKAWKNNKNTIISEQGNIFKKSTFGSIDLVNFLKEKESRIKSIELLGICTDICVISNAVLIKNFLPDTPVFVNENLCAGTDKKNHKEALNIMEMIHVKRIAS